MEETSIIIEKIVSPPWRFLEDKKKKKTIPLQGQFLQKKGGRTRPQQGDNIIREELWHLCELRIHDRCSYM